MNNPKIDLASLYEEVFEMIQERRSLEGYPYSDRNPYTPPKSEDLNNSEASSDSTS